ncbi:hypothetical protein FVER53590_11744 [Fusarium verticillioides]|nr:hypothetical protein FVER53590_11744 [Fusarium verticillioides]
MYHHNEALTGFRRELSTITKENSEALFTWSICNVLYVFATSNPLYQGTYGGPTSLLAAQREQVLGSEWIPMIRGLEAVLQPTHNYLRSGSMKAIMSTGNWDDLDPEQASQDHEDVHFCRALETWRDSDCAEVYEEALQVLRKCRLYSSQFREMDSETRSGTYSIAHRDTNAVLNVDLQQGAMVRSKSGAMIHMSGSIELAGKSKFSLGKLFTGGNLYESTYTGPGRVALGPTLFGDIITLPVDGHQSWTIGRDAFLASTSEVSKKRETQGIGKALFSGEDLFVFRIEGQGIMWLTSFGAVDRLDLRPGEEHIVDNGHLVAWSCKYSIEKAGGGAMTGMKTGEGLVCRFTGPGSVYVQTRNMDEFQSFIKATVGA